MSKGHQTFGWLGHTTYLWGLPLRRGQSQESVPPKPPLPESASWGPEPWSHNWDERKNTQRRELGMILDAKFT